jgi:hypothetical protein
VRICILRDSAYYRSDAVRYDVLLNDKLVLRDSVVEAEEGEADSPGWIRCFLVEPKSGLTMRDPDDPINPLVVCVRGKVTLVPPESAQADGV